MNALTHEHIAVNKQSTQHNPHQTNIMTMPNHYRPQNGHEGGSGNVPDRTQQGNQHQQQFLLNQLLAQALVAQQQNGNGARATSNGAYSQQHAAFNNQGFNMARGDGGYHDGGQKQQQQQAFTGAGNQSYDNGALSSWLARLGGGKGGGHHQMQNTQQAHNTTMNFNVAPGVSVTQPNQHMVRYA
jgi:hypothetical protein